MKPKKIYPSEYQEQCALVKWLEIKNIKFTSVPNSTYTPSQNAKRKNYCSGLRAGLPDLLLVLTPAQSRDGQPKLLFIEMKKVKGPKARPEQIAWIEALDEVEGVEANVCHGADEAIAFVNIFLIN